MTGILLHIGATLVLTKFQVSDADGRIEISGRATGLWAWLLRVLGIGAQTVLTVDRQNFRLESRSLSGTHTGAVPLAGISSIHSGFTRPAAYIVLTVVAVILALGWLIAGFSEGGVDGEMMKVAGAVALVVAVILFVVYVLSKRLYVVVHTSGGLALGMKFKKGVLEQTAIDKASLDAAMEVVNRNITAVQAG